MNLMLLVFAVLLLISQGNCLDAKLGNRLSIRRISNAFPTLKTRRSGMISDNNPESMKPQLSKLLQYLPLVLWTGYFANEYIIPKAMAMGGKFPIYGEDSIMSPKKHGTSDAPVQDKLKWACDTQLADRICNYNRRWAESAGYWSSSTKFLEEVTGESIAKNGPLTFYDSVTGKPLFIAPKNRSFEDWVQESRVHGWPSFRDDEVVWENVRALSDGETVSLTGTHLGHNLPDRKGNRYCINLVSIAGYSDSSLASAGLSVCPQCSRAGCLCKKT